MKNLSLLTLMAFAAGIFVLASCKKDDSPKDLLTGQSCWKVVKQEIRVDATAAWTTEIVDACTADDCTSFDADGKTATDEGATKCDPADPQSSTGTYVLTEDGKTLTVTQDGFTLPFAVEELTSKKMVLTSSFIGDTRTTLEAQ